jgi:HAMP domain-containing protein
MLKSIKFRVLLIIGTIGAFPLAGFIAWEYYQSIDRLRLRCYEQLKTVREIKKRELEAYFLKLRDETNFFAQSNVVINAMKEFNSSFEDLNKIKIPSEYEKNLQTYYSQLFQNSFYTSSETSIFQTILPKDNRSILLQNQYLVGTKAAFKEIPYFNVHTKFHESLSSFINTYDLYDLMLIEDKTGYILYSVSKEIDFATSLLSGPFADNNIGILFRKIRYCGLKNKTIMCDFERYLPSSLAPSAFIAAPIFEGEIKIGTLILQVPLKKMDEITTGTKTWENEGLGKTGETYIVGSDYKMRTDSRFMIESSSGYLEMIKNAGTATKKEIDLMAHYKTSVLFQQVNSETATKALAKTSGTMTIKDYRDRSVLSSYAPLNIEDVSWALLAEIDSEEVFNSVRQGAKQSVFLLVVVVIILIIASILLARTIYKPISILAAGTRKLGEGNFDVQFDIKTKDELGELAETFNKTIQSLKEQRDEIVLKNSLLDEQKNELASQSENLKILNEEISEINKLLDLKVKERTSKLLLQNEKLIEYAHFNSHQLRAPVATILGLLNLIQQSPNENDRKTALELLKKATKDLDIITSTAQDLLNSAEFKE